MSKSKEELESLKREVESLNNKLAELNEEELEQVIGGLRCPTDPHEMPDPHVIHERPGTQRGPSTIVVEPPSPCRPHIFTDL